MARNTTKTPDQRGSAGIETALLIPAMVLMLTGILETGNLFMTWLTVQKAAQVGTRFAATGQGDLEGDRLQRIKTEAGKLLAPMTNGDATIEVRSWVGPRVAGSGRLNNPGQPCDLVQVKVDFQYHSITPLGGLVEFIKDLAEEQEGGEFVVNQEAYPTLLTLSGMDQKVNEPWHPCN